MNELNFTYMSAKNFVCFGEEGIELDLTKYGNVILVRGDNLDLVEDEERVASNGVGKSTIADILVYGLFGKPIKHPKKMKKDDIVNNQTKGKMEIEIRWNDYKVVRKRLPNSLHLYRQKNGEWKEVAGGLDHAQAEIEKVLGYNYASFVNSSVFTDNNNGAFLECDTDSKRGIVDNLLPIHELKRRYEDTKEFRKTAKADQKSFTALYEQLLDELESRKTRVTQIVEREKGWRKDKQAEIQVIEKKIKEKETELRNSGDQGEALANYEAAQEKTKELAAQIPDLEEEEKKVTAAAKAVGEKLDEARKRKHSLEIELQDAQSAHRNAQAEITKAQNTIESLEKKEGTRCPTCMGVVSKDNYQPVIRSAQSTIAEQEIIVDAKAVTIQELETKIDVLSTNTKKLEVLQSTISQKASQISNKLVAVRKNIGELSKIRKPEAGTDEKILAQQITELKEQRVAKEVEATGPSPFVEILKSAEEEVETKRRECRAKKEELNEIEDDLLYWEFLVKAFDKEIRRFAVDEILPSLNFWVAHWLDFLIDGKIKVVFDNQLEDTIERNPPDGNPYVYYAMSGGERRRINLAVSQAFAHIMMISSNNSPSLVFLDEVTTNVDPIGVEGIYNMIQELARNKQVFVTTHDQGLLEMLAGCDKLELRRKNGFTKLV